MKDAIHAILTGPQTSRPCVHLCSEQKDGRKVVEEDENHQDEANQGGRIDRREKMRLVERKEHVVDHQKSGAGKRALPDVA